MHNKDNNNLNNITSIRIKDRAKKCTKVLRKKLNTSFFISSPSKIYFGVKSKPHMKVY